MVLGAESGEKRVRGLPPGGTALYDSSGNILKIVGSSVDWDLVAPLTIKLGGVTFKITSGGVEITGGTVKHNGKNIGSSHIHGGVEPGGSNTAPPAN